MNRLLIVDDEEMIVDWLEQLFLGRESLDLEILTAFSAKQALEWMEKTSIDIMLTDICMPGMDGLELQRRVLERWSRCKVIFLTGHEEFEYMYTAERQGSARYLLKTEDDDVIVSAVAKAIEEIAQERKYVLNEKRVEGYEREMHSQLLQVYFEDLVLGHLPAPTKRRMDFERLGIKLDAEAPVFLMSCQRTDPEGNSSDPTTRLLRQTELSILIEQVLSHMANVNLVALGSVHLFILLQPIKDGDSASMLNYISATLEVLQREAWESLGVELTLLLDSQAVQWEKLSDRVMELRHLSNTRSIQGSLEHVTIGEDLHKANTALRDLRISLNTQLRNLDLMSGYLENGQKKQFFSLLDSLLQVIREAYKTNPSLARQAYLRLSLMLLTYIQENEIITDMDLEPLYRSAPTNTLDASDAYLHALCEHLFSMHQHGQDNLLIATLDQVIYYISEHMDAKLSIITLAEQVHFSPSYLSRIFKQQMGEGLAEYVLRQRLNHAKFLLCETEEQIYKIAQMVGYPSATVFGRLFKRETGLTPLEFRSNKQYIDEIPDVAYRHGPKFMKEES